MWDWRAISSCFDQFPRDYYSFARRNHRWIRGDWQIIDWLANKVPTMGDIPNAIHSERWSVTRSSITCAAA